MTDDVSTLDSARPRRRRVDGLPFISSALCSTLAITALVIALTAAVLLALAGPGFRLGWWSYRGGMIAVAAAFFLGILGILVGLAGAIRGHPGSGRPGFEISVMAMIIAAIVSAAPVAWRWVAREAPEMRDVSTDPADPPQFTTLRPPRMASSEAGRLPGDAGAATTAYPGVTPLVLDATPGETYARALDVARELGWTVVAADSARGRFEAVASSRWFGMKDDIAVRVRPVRGGSRIDVRAVDDGGVEHDGTNARRIRHFLALVARNL